VPQNHGAYGGICFRSHAWEGARRLLRCLRTFQFHFADRFLEREHLVHSFRWGKSGLKIAHLLAQHPSRAIILRLTRLGGILFETRYRAGYDWIEILCHQPEKTPVGGVVEASDDDQPWTKLLA